MGRIRNDFLPNQATTLLDPQAADLLLQGAKAGTAPQAATLPAASAFYRGRIMLHLGGGAGGRDRLVVCLRSASGAYNWVQIADGGT